MVNACTLVATPSAVSAPPMPGEYLAFQLGAEQYGIDILRVQEIRSYEPPTRMVHAPDFIKGVIDLRGRIVPILDLRIKLRCVEVAYNEFTVVIILNIGATTIGAVVDSVADVVSLAPERIKPASQFDHDCDMDGRYIQGIADVDGRMLILMDISALLSTAETGLVTSAASTASA